jgi:carbonic anhydrase/acetyltransferase-like protein (isoleucine patch superfamily)
MTIRKFSGITPTIGEKTYIDQSAQVIGNVKIGEHSSVWPLVTIRGDVNSISIGNNTNIQDNSVLHVTHYGKYDKGAALHIGNHVTVGHQCILHACTIQDFCLIGMGSSVLDNTVIEPYVFLGAGSLVAEGKTLESGFLYLGRPAKKIRELTDEEKEFLGYSAEHYAKLKNQYLLEVK